jgi:hypothetical protein
LIGPILIATGRLGPGRSLGGGIFGVKGGEEAREGNSLVGRMRSRSISSALSFESSISIIPEMEVSAGMGMGMLSGVSSGGLSSAGSSGSVPSAGTTTTGQHR